MESENFVLPKKSDYSRLLFGLLCLMTVIVSFSGRFVELIVFYEILFILIYLLIEKKEALQRIFNLSRFRSNKLATVFISGWFLISILSFLFSPYELLQNPFAISRLWETFIHIVLFFILLDYMSQYQPSVSYILAPVYLSILITAFIFLSVLYNSEIPYSSYSWFTHPVLNFHIRTTGDQATAAVAVLSVLLLVKSTKTAESLFYVIMNIIGWTFVFWMGGRGTILGLWVMIFIITSYLIYMKLPVVRFVAYLIIINIVAFVLSEWLVKFEWNGFLNTIDRIVAAESANRLSSGRVTIWLESLAALKQSYWIGLGPSAINYIPDLTIRVTHPHSLIVQFLLDWGIIGTIFFVGLLILAFIKGFELHLDGLIRKGVLDRQAIVRLASGGAIIAMSAHAMTDGNYFYQQPLYYLVIIYALWMAPGHKLKT